MKDAAAMYDRMVDAFQSKLPRDVLDRLAIASAPSPLDKKVAKPRSRQQIIDEMRSWRLPLSRFRPLLSLPT